MRRAVWLKLFSGCEQHERRLDLENSLGLLGHIRQLSPI
jgi:hypothetical protein